MIWLSGFYADNHGQSLDGSRLFQMKVLSSRIPHRPDNTMLGWDKIYLQMVLRIEHGGTLFTYSSDAALFPESGYLW